MMNDENVICCLIVDDEPLAREILRRYILEVPGMQLAGECSNAVQAFTFLQTHKVDLVFLDIRMPQLNGIDFIKTFKNPPKVIFTTAFAEYALEGYELDVVDYLLKPFPFERFLKAVGKVFELLNLKDTTTVIASEEKKTEPFVYFRSDRKMIKVLLDEILYIESMKDYIKVITKNTSIITKQSISSVFEMLPEKDFVRVHRSYIVAVKNIKSYTYELIETGTAQIPIGKLYRNEVMRRME